VRAQIQAGYDNGVRSWMLWNPGSRYTLGALAPRILAEEQERRRSAPPADETARVGAGSRAARDSAR
jgi:hypothetical protein